MGSTPLFDSKPSSKRRRSGLGWRWLPLIALSGWLAVDLYVWAIEVAAIGFAITVVQALDGCRFGHGERLAMARFPRGIERLLNAYILVMLIGATWTYAGAPPGAWLQHTFGLARNPWDRIGHVLQGALPAWIALQLCVRGARVRGLAPQLALGLGAGLAIAGLFEGLEALAASVAPAGVDFVQAQGDPFDRWWDLGFALIGAGAATLSANVLSARAGVFYQATKSLGR